ncbi:hypothetical protein LTR78_010799 [Recurvomyces mirabilis]|uniref:Uncharacterized protein n=1 Tax=Recurvomyces mirabilis TaxID=574656 RepID=A0AAE0WGP9_9PEZI|nr:hypothetical protein LTR78_010799 [Recurvomyces mirabilis]KAK5149503.1 hypothetical protein LTS14_010869 [Recurvomyces mirabilis]
MATTMPHTAFELFNTGAIPSEALQPTTSATITSPTITATFVTKIVSAASSSSTATPTLTLTTPATLNNGTTCITLQPGELVISRTSFIIALTLCIFITTASVITLLAFAYRNYRRRRETQQARAWGRRSVYNRRMSVVRKEVDYFYSTKHGGCLVHVPENPELGSDEVVEIGDRERLFEVPAEPAKAALVGSLDRAKRKSRLKSLFFDEKVGVWLSKS